MQYNELSAESNESWNNYNVFGVSIFEWYGARALSLTHTLTYNNNNISKSISETVSNNGDRPSRLVSVI